MTQWHKAEMEKPTDNKQYLVYVYYTDDGSYYYITDVYNHDLDKWEQENADWNARVLFWTELPEAPC